MHWDMEKWGHIRSMGLGMRTNSVLTLAIVNDKEKV